ncbi:MAG: hypothetical protein ACFFEY_05015 [Candidatus Thorarchaeota archaeon]
MNNPNVIFEILEASYVSGARGVEVVPAGKILEAARMMIERYDDYVILGSTYPGENPMIDALINVGAKLIFVHGMISDNRGATLLKIIEEISSSGVIPGIATHNPIPTIKFCIKNSLNVKFFLIPFNSQGFLMGNKEELEQLVDNAKDFYFIGMKTLAAGIINPGIAFEYIIKHNICALTIGMINNHQAAESTAIALKALNKKVKTE